MSDFVDTNVFIRVLTNDDPTKFARCLALFEEANLGRRRLVTSEAVVAEIVYVLSSRTYGISRGQIAAALIPLLSSRGIRVEHKRSVLDALELYDRSNLDLEDCLSVAHTRRLRLNAIYSYDRDFDHVASVRRLEP
jgi:predicted nucleic acid-binding protein